jgi:hypothetical protein
MIQTKKVILRWREHDGMRAQEEDGACMRGRDGVTGELMLPLCDANGCEAAAFAFYFAVAASPFVPFARMSLIFSNGWPSAKQGEKQQRCAEVSANSQRERAERRSDDQPSQRMRLTDERGHLE